MKCSRRSVSATFLVLLSGLAISAMASGAGTRVNFTSLDASHPYNVSGTLYLPDGAKGPVPVMVVIHGTGGIDSRGALYREPMLNAGIGMFEVDFKTGIYNGTMDRPPNDVMVPLAFAALKELRKLPSVDPERIGIMGFSMGGGITIRTAVEAYRKQWMGDDKGFAVHVGFYPVCRYFIPELERTKSQLTGAPMIIFYGTEDSYGEGQAVPQLKRLLASKYNFDLTTVEYAGATHAFNRNGPALSYADPAAIGGKGYMKWDPDATNDSVPKVVAFLEKALGMS